MNTKLPQVNTARLYLLLTQEQAASTIVYCAVHPSMDNISGLYMYECWPAVPSPEAQDLTTAAALWQLSEQLIADKMASA